MPIGQAWKLPRGVTKWTLLRLNIVCFVRATQHKRGIMLAKFPASWYNKMILSNVMVVHGCTKLERKMALDTINDKV
jgi:hypothetical protein